MPGDWDYIKKRSGSEYSVPMYKPNSGSSGREGGMTQRGKSLHISMPRWMYEKFYRMFPGQGERARMVREMIKILFEVVEDQPDLLEEFKERILLRLL